MTKAEIIDVVYEKVGGFSKKEASEIVEAVFDTMKDVLAGGQKIKISGFGNFVVREKKERIGRNPQTGAPIPISARRVLTFKPSQVLKGLLNPHRLPPPTQEGGGPGDDAVGGEPSEGEPTAGEPSGVGGRPASSASRGVPRGISRDGLEDSGRVDEHSAS